MVFSRLRQIGLCSTLVASSLFLAACSDDGSDPMSSESSNEMDIIDTAISAGSFNTLVAAVQAAGLEATLRGNGPFTVFAPTDEAFAKLPAGTVEDLLKPENKDRLVSILTYHVVPGRVMAADVIGLTSAATVQGSLLMIDAANGAVKIDNATVIQTDIATTNGVIHAIDTVVLPQ